MIEIKTTTYGCVCGYKVDGVLFENRPYFEGFSASNGVMYGTCPSCKSEQLARILDPNDLSTHNTVEADDIDTLTEVERDEFGQKVMVDTGEVKQEIGIIDGQVGVVETPIFVEKTRELTTKEKQDKLEEANRTIDALGVQEFNPNQVASSPSVVTGISQPEPTQGSAPTDQPSITI